MPEGLTDEAGEIVWEYSYQLLGKLIQETEYISVQQK
ncbi:RHS protein, partial [Snodgrassella alvi SCGC AB-598-O11]